MCEGDSPGRCSLLQHDPLAPQTPASSSQAHQAAMAAPCLRAVAAHAWCAHQGTAFWAALLSVDSQCKGQASPGRCSRLQHGLLGGSLAQCNRVLHDRPLISLWAGILPRNARGTPGGTSQPPHGMRRAPRALSMVLGLLLSLLLLLLLLLHDGDLEVLQRVDGAHGACASWHAVACVRMHLAGSTGHDPWRGSCKLWGEGDVAPRLPVASGHLAIAPVQLARALPRHLHASAGPTCGREPAARVGECDMVLREWGSVSVSADLPCQDLSGLLGAGMQQKRVTRWSLYENGLSMSILNVRCNAEASSSCCIQVL